MKIKFVICCSMILLIAAVFCAFAEKGSPQENPAGKETAGVHRIVSLAPSITELLFALGVGDRIVGVTRQCRYPLPAQRITKIGGYYDPNYEQIMRLKPDCVVLSVEQAPEKRMVEGLGLRVLVVDHMTVAGIVRSFSETGKLCNVEARAALIARDLAAKMEQIREKTASLKKPHVMVSIGRGMGSGVLRDLFIAGRRTFYDDLITLAGGENVCTGKTVKYPQVELEGIYKLDPEIVIDMAPAGTGVTITREALLAEWNKAVHLKAVKNNRVYIFDQDYATVPGPRFIVTLEQMARDIHPEIEWQ